MERREEERGGARPRQVAGGYVEHLAKAGEDYVVDTPWAKLGLEGRYAIGFVVVQVLLLVFTSGIGNGVVKHRTCSASSRNAWRARQDRQGRRCGSRRSRQARARARRRPSSSSRRRGQADRGGDEDAALPRQGPCPVGEVFEKLQKFLRKLFNVVEKDAAAVLEAAGGKTAAALAEDAPKIGTKSLAPPEPPGVPPTKPPVRAAPVGEADSAASLGAKPAAKEATAPKPTARRARRSARSRPRRLQRRPRHSIS
jgi:hypothetical protein